ncbi:RNA polymerase sigma factor [Colwellia sp. KU-HH00111]|uniref:RNA polymerase sigma factor n=1 Tax=Colwellia sp. KU-HH00111 TaxID=3127652 RepID=UPI003108780A
MKLPSMIKGWLNTTITPERLLEHYVSTNDEKYLTLLVEQFNLSIYHYLISLSDKETAEDVLQTTWLKVMKVQSLTTKHTNVKSWLYTIARNTLIDELRRQQKWQWQALEAHHLNCCSPAQEFEMNDRLASFNFAINQLPFYQREAFIFQQEGLSIIEICDVTNEHFETVKSRLRYARKNLKEMLGTPHEQ